MTPSLFTACGDTSDIIKKLMVEGSEERVISPRILSLLISVVLIQLLQTLISFQKM